jgi:hypothetical protein
MDFNQRAPQMKKLIFAILMLAAVSIPVTVVLMEMSDDAAAQSGGCKRGKNVRQC